MIANAIKQAYSGTALAKSSVGIRTPSKSTNRVLSRCALFLLPVVYDRLCRGDSSRRPLAGSSNSVQSVTLIRTSGGSSLNQQEDTTMSNDLARIEKGCRLFSQLSHEKQFICLTILKNPKLLEILDRLPRDHVAVISEHMWGLLFGEANHV